MRSDLHEANRLSWNAATRAHNSHKADQAAFFRNGGSTLYPEELQLLGHLDGLRLLHLQCNAGQDSLSLARLGARVDRRPARRRPATRTAGGIPLRQRLGRLRRHARRRRRTHAAARRSSAPAADVRPQRKETTMTEERLLRRDEIPLVWEIDRSEVIEHLYSVEAGQLVLRPEFYDMRGWPEGEAEHYTPILLDCFDRGGWFLGLFDQGRLIGAVVLDPRRLGPERDWLQLKFLHLSHAYRRRGLGAHLFHLAATQARHLGASALYVSATPSQNTVDFYTRLGCRLCMEPDEELYRLEPEDVHLVFNL